MLLDALERPATYVPVDIAEQHLGLAAAQRLVFFPGSTPGNFANDAAGELPGQLRRVAGPTGRLLIGIDLQKSTSRLLQAYDDAAGVTATFNLAAFRHRAFWNERRSRIEMHLVSTRRQVVMLGGQSLQFEPGEAIVSEYSHKYSLPGFASLAEAAGWTVARVWTDDGRDFSVQLLAPATIPAT